MRLPKSWLCEYIDFNVTDQEFIEKMMWRGFELDGYERELNGVSGVITGKILKMESHPNANKLTVCQVDLGDKTAQILTNAKNVFEGAVVPVAYAGAKIGSQEFTVANIRGVESYGMFCSGQEFNLTESEFPGAGVDGILILPVDTPLGMDIAKALGRDDVIFDFAVLPNRPDCNSIIGLAREAAAALGQTMREPVLPHIPGEGDAADYASVTVENTELCPRYCGRVMKDIVIEPAPVWMQRRLRMMGMRPINNIVDITNYVLMEYGHPMHAFDLSCISGGHIVVRNAAEGEKVTTLDNKERIMDKDMLLIADPEKGVGVAGVMGGLNSEITPETKAVFFESAVFKASNIRHTAKKLRHSTDASARFVKGVEPVNAYLALERCIELMAKLHAGKVVGDPIDVCNADLSPKVVTVDIDHVNRLLNTRFSGEQMAALLAPIHLGCTPQGKTMDIVLPHYRTDIEKGIEADHDIAEEVGRVYGFENIPPVLMHGDTFQGSIAPVYLLEDRIKDILVSCGCLEMYNYNFTGPTSLKNLCFAPEDTRNKAVRLLNPFGEDQSLMRTTLYMGMLDSVARNLNRKTGYGRFMEVGNIHLDLGGELPEEHKKVGLAFFGDSESFFTLKGVIETLLYKLRVPEVSFRKGGAPCYQPGRGAEIYSGNTKLGEMGQFHPDVLSSFSIKQPVYMAELDFEALHRTEKEELTFEPLPRFPLVNRDLAVVVDNEQEAAYFMDVIRKAQSELLVENVELFDVYRGAGVPLGKKSLAFTFSLRSPDHTLSEEEIRKAFDAIIEALKNCGAPLRS